MIARLRGENNDIRLFAVTSFLIYVSPASVHMLDWIVSVLEGRNFIQVGRSGKDASRWGVDIKTDIAVVAEERKTSMKAANTTYLNA